jgi:hypothetical protein
VPPDLANSDHPEITGIRCSAANSMICLPMLHDQPIRQDDHCFGARSTYALKRRLDLGGRLHLSKRKPKAEPVGALLGSSGPHKPSIPHRLGAQLTTSGHLALRGQMEPMLQRLRTQDRTRKSTPGFITLALRVTPGAPMTIINEGSQFWIRTDAAC